MGLRPHLAAKRTNATYRYMFMRADGLQLESMNQLIDSGALRPNIDAVYPFEKVAEAIERSESGKARGKVVIQMRY
jgi:NADPH:quinone reductase-like Zn-dependent oxidoreductase